MENAAEVHHQLQLLQGQAKFSTQWEVEHVDSPKQRHDSVDNSPQRRPRHDTDDESPERRSPKHSHRTADATAHIVPQDFRGLSQKQGSPEDASPQRRRPRHDTDDESPPRRPGAETGPYSSVIEGRHVPPRHATQDGGPVQRPHRYDTDDESPARRRPVVTARPDEHDASPPRRGAAVQRHGNYRIYFGHVPEKAVTSRSQKPGMVAGIATSSHFRGRDNARHDKERSPSSRQGPVLQPNLLALDCHNSIETLHMTFTEHVQIGMIVEATCSMRRMNATAL